MTAVSYQNKLLSSTSPPPPPPPPPPASPPTPTPAFFLSFFVRSLCGRWWIKFGEKSKCTFFLQFLIFPPFPCLSLQISQGYSIPALVDFWGSHLEWIMTRGRKKKGNKPKDSGKRGHVMTCLQLEAIRLCSFHTSRTVGLPRCAKTNIGQHDKYAL